jgi:hypothetical protein
VTEVGCGRLTMCSLGGFERRSDVPAGYVFSIS